MPETITSFFTFVKRRPAYGEDVDTNFANFRGSRLPIAENTETTADLSHEIGTAEHPWNRVGVQTMVIGNTSGANWTIDGDKRAWFQSGVLFDGTAPASHGWTTRSTSGSVTWNPNSTLPGGSFSIESKNGNPIEVIISGQLTMEATASSSALLEAFWLVDNSGGASGSGLLNHIIAYEASDSPTSGSLLLSAPFTFHFVVDTYDRAGMTITTEYQWDFKSSSAAPTATIEDLKVLAREAW